jgi:hypothetical protein
LPVPGGPIIGDFQRALGACLALDLAQVGQRHGRRVGVGHGPRQRGGQGRVARQQRTHHVEQVVRRMDDQALDTRRLARTGRGQHQCAWSHRTGAPLQRQRHRECTPHRPQVASQRQLAGKLECGQRRRIELPAGRQDAQRDRQVEAARFLRQVGRRQVDGDAFVARELQPAVLQRGAHPFARFLHFGVGQPDQRDARQAVGQMHFDGDFRRIKRVKRAAVDDGKRHVFSPNPLCPRPLGAGVHHAKAKIQNGADEPKEWANAPEVGALSVRPGMAQKLQNVSRTPDFLGQRGAVRTDATARRPEVITDPQPGEEP